MEKRIKTGGRVAGTPNKTPSETKELLKVVLSKEVEKLSTLLAKLDPLDRINAIAKLLPYIVPKQQQHEFEVSIINAENYNEQKEQRLIHLVEKLAASGMLEKVQLLKEKS